MSPSAVNMGQALKARKRLLRDGSRTHGAGHGGGVGDGAGDWVLPSMPSEPALNTVSMLAGMMVQLQRAGHGELLIAAASAGCAVEGDGDLAARR